MTRPSSRPTPASVNFLISDAVTEQTVCGFAGDFAKYSSVSVTAPASTLSASSRAPSRRNTNSVLPPPVSKIVTKPSSAPPMLRIAARLESSASASPGSTATPRPQSSRTREEKSAAFAARRSAIVPTQRISSAPSARAKAANFATACAVRSIASAESAPLPRIPSPSFVMTFMSQRTRAAPPSEAPPSVSFTEFVPISITAFFIINSTSSALL